MEQRINIETVLPAAYKAMYALSVETGNSSLTPIQKELIKIRASQMNACAFCLDMHAKDALKYGEKKERIFLLNAWRDTTLFTAEEKAILAMTEEITMISQKGLSEETYNHAGKFFTPSQIGEIIMLIVTINSWNRIAVSTHLQVPG